MASNDYDFKTIFGKSELDGRWILSTAEEAKDYVVWLTHKSGYSKQEIIYELENQISPLADNSFSVSTILSDALNEIPIVCQDCGKIVKYGDTSVAETKTLTGRSSRVVARNLLGATRVREITHSYEVSEHRLCEDCYNKFCNKRRKEKRKNILRIIIGAVIYLVLFLSIFVILELLKK